MTYILKHNPDITNFFSYFFGEDLVALTLFPWIFTKYEKINENIVNHEKIHIEQYKETLIIGFPIIMIINYILNLIYYFDLNIAYKNTLFEKEAYENMNNYQYLKYRRRYSWLFPKKIE